MSARAIVATAGLAFGSLLTVGGAATASTGDVLDPSTPSTSGGFVELDGWVYAAGDGANALLWRTDGAVFEPVAGVATDDDLFAFDLAAFDGWIYFSGDGERLGSELWRTDGSTTELVADLSPGPDGSRPLEKIVYRDALYFTTFDDLWRFDGVTVERVPNADQIPLGDLVEHDGWLYIAGPGGIHRTDGAVVEFVSDIEVRGDRELFAGSTPPVSLGDWLYFAGYTDEHGVELWRTDGDVTELAADVWPGPAPSEPYGITAFDGWVWFGATTPDTGGELWRSNGSTTELVADISAGPGGDEGMGSSYPSSFVSLGDWLYFTAEAEFAATAFWRTNGTVTERFADLAPSPYVNDTADVGTFGEWLYFTGPSRQVWRTDGVTIERVGAPGTPLVADYTGDDERWTSTVYTPADTGRYLFVLEWFGSSTNAAIDVREESSGRWIAADTSDESPKVVAADLVGGVDYRVAAWPVRSYVVSVIEPEVGPPAGEVVFSGTVDASGVAAPRWVSSTLVPESTGDLTLLLDWDGGADVRFDVRDVATGRWLGAATVGPAPRSATVEVVAGEPIRLAVWAASGTAGFELATDGAPPPEPETVFAGTVDAGRVTAPKWVSTTFTAESTGPHTFSFGDGSDPDLRMEVRESASGTWLAAGHPTVDVDLSAGTEYRLAVWVVDGRADFEVTLEPPAG